MADQPAIERFSKLKFPVHKITAETPEELFRVLPGLRRFFQNVTVDRHTGEPVSANRTHEDTVGTHFFNMPADLVRFIKYIVYVYDPDSDFVDEYPDLKTRKEASAIEAGWKRNEHDEWPDWIKEIMTLKNKVAIQYILNFLQVKKQAVWSEIIFLSEELDHINETRMNDMAYAIKNNYADAAEDRGNKLAALLKKFYREHKDLEKETVKEIFPISPENFLKELAIEEDWYKVRQTTDVS